MVKEKYKKKIITAISQLLPECKIYLFGSRAGVYKISFDSDIDVGIDLGNPIPKKSLMKIEDVIYDLDIPLDIDIVDYQKASAELKKEIKEKGILWKS